MSDSVFSSVPTTRHTTTIKSVPILRNYYVQWEISNFKYIVKDTGEFMESDTFTTGINPKIKWSINLYPNGYESDEHVSLFLTNESNYDATIEFQVSILGQERALFKMEKVTVVKIPAERNWGIENFIRREELMNDSKLLHNGTLTIVFEIRAVDGFETTRNTCCCTKLKNDNNLALDFKKLLASSEWSDLTISVGEKKFPVHFTVLAARSRVFAAMFRNDMEESRSNTIEISDIDPDVMEEVLHYIYTGKCNRLNEMAEKLIQVAEKYDLDGLKDLCEKVLVKQLTEENAADTLIVADLYNRRKLKRKTFDFIKKHRDEVLSGSSWKKMATSHPNLEIEGLRAMVKDQMLH